MALGHTDLEELGEDRADTDGKQESVPVVNLLAWAVGDRMHTVNSASCIAAMLDMDTHMATAVDMEVMVMAIAVMFAKAQSQMTSLEQERPLEAEAKVEALCWTLAAEHSMVAVMW